MRIIYDSKFINQALGLLIGRNIVTSSSIGFRVGPTGWLVVGSSIKTAIFAYILEGALPKGVSERGY